jgi:hypothetical protein
VLPETNFERVRRGNVVTRRVSAGVWRTDARWTRIAMRAQAKLRAPGQFVDGQEKGAGRARNHVANTARDQVRCLRQSKRKADGAPICRALRAVGDTLMIAGVAGARTRPAQLPKRR